MARIHTKIYTKIRKRKFEHFVKRGVISPSKGVRDLGFSGYFWDLFWIFRKFLIFFGILRDFLGFDPEKCTGFFQSYLTLVVKCYKFHLSRWAVRTTGTTLCGGQTKEENPPTLCGMITPKLDSLKLHNIGSLVSSNTHLHSHVSEFFRVYFGVFFGWGINLWIK